MPFIEIRNLPEYPDSTFSQREMLTMKLRDAAIAAKVPGITRLKHVTVTCGGAALSLSDNETIGIIVEFLFVRPDRTKEVLDRLAERLYTTARECFSNEYRIEVMVRPFDTSVGAYRTD